MLDYRDRAILKFFLYSGARLSTACGLRVSDFHQDGEEATIRLHEKGDKRRTIGLHFQAAQAISEYIEKAALTVPGVNEVRVKLVWSPPWDRDRMSEEAKLELGMM